MVGKVMQWKKTQPEEAERVWTALAEANEGLKDVCQALSDAAARDEVAYTAEVSRLAGLPAIEVSDGTCLLCGTHEPLPRPDGCCFFFVFFASFVSGPSQSCRSVRPSKASWCVPHSVEPAPCGKRSREVLHGGSSRGTSQQTRALMREMGTASDVPIEPAEQTRLLDTCSALPGVVGAGVPGGQFHQGRDRAPDRVGSASGRAKTRKLTGLRGVALSAAGGYDAIWVLCLDPPAPSASSPARSSAPPRPAAAVEALLRSYADMSVGPLAKSAWVRGGTSGGEAGLLRERGEDVPGLLEAVKRAKQY